MSTFDVEYQTMSLTAANNIMGFVKDFFTNALQQGYTPSHAMKLWDEQKDTIKEMIDDSMVVKKEAKKKDSSPKDPNKPKRGRSAYLFYAMDIRSSVKKELGEGTKPADVTKEIAARWKEIRDSEKKTDKTKFAKYTKMAEKDKERAAKEMATYEPPTDEEIMAAKPKRGRKPSPESKSKKPTKGRNAYIFFCADHRQDTKDKNPDLDSKEITKLLSEMWKEVKEDDGDEYLYYKKKSDADKKRYEQEMKIYVPSDDEDEEDYEAAPKKAKKDKKATPKQIDTVGFKKYSNANRDEVEEENPGLKTAQITKLLKEEWNELDNDAKKEWFEEDQE